MFLHPATEEQRKCVIEDTNFDDFQMQKKIEQIKEWMKMQPHLPHISEKIADKLIFGFLCGTKMSTEIAKYKIDTYYAMRHQLPEIYQDRDPTLRDIRDSVDIIRYFPLSHLTPDGVRVNVISFNSNKGKKFTVKDMKAFHKRVMLVGDVRLQLDEFCRGEYIVVDTSGVYFSHISEIPWAMTQRFAALSQEGLPVRIKGIFVINAPTFIETVINLVKPALKEKIKKRIHVFHGDHTNLYKFIPQRILPSNFGGEAPSIEESSRIWQNIIESFRGYFIEDGKRKTDESKRPPESANNYGQTFGLNGSFNQLNID